MSGKFFPLLSWQFLPGIEKKESGYIRKWFRLSWTNRKHTVFWQRTGGIEWSPNLVLFQILLQLSTKVILQTIAQMRPFKSCFSSCISKPKIFFYPLFKDTVNGSPDTTIQICDIFRIHFANLSEGKTAAIIKSFLSPTFFLRIKNENSPCFYNAFPTLQLVQTD